MLTFTLTWQFVLGLIGIGFFVGFGWAFGAWIAGGIIGLFRRGG